MEKYKNVEEANKILANMELEIKELRDFISKNQNREAEMENLFLSLINDNNLVFKVEPEYNRNTWYNSEGEWVIEQNIKNKVIWFSYDRFWSKFENKFNLNYDEIKSFLSGMVSKHLNLEGYTVLNGCNRLLCLVSKHLNLEGYTV